jgi:hypothetical protein
MVFANIIPAFSQMIDGVLTSTTFGTDVLNLFDYKACRGSLKFIWLVNELDVVVCPYCNLNHTHTIKTTDDVKILYEFDHFIPKVSAPYLSLSFFNLIPSCHDCNSNLKSNLVFNLNEYTHPYCDDLNSWVSFSTDNPVNIDDVNSFDVVIKTITTNSEQIRKSATNIAVFAIQQRYNHFKEDIIRLEKMKSKYSESKKQELLNDGLLGEIFTNRADLDSYLALLLDIPVNELEAGRKARGKFKLDIAKEFKILD